MTYLARDREGQERDGSRPLDGERHLALVARTVARDAPGNDLAAVADEVLQRLRVFVVDDHGLVRAELANALACAAPSAGRIRVQVRRPAEVLVVAEVDVALAHDSSLPPSASGVGAGVGAGLAVGPASALDAGLTQSPSNASSINSS